MTKKIKSFQVRMFENIG